MSRCLLAQGLHFISSLSVTNYSTKINDYSLLKWSLKVQPILLWGLFFTVFHSFIYLVFVALVKMLANTKHLYIHQTDLHLLQSLQEPGQERLNIIQIQFVLLTLTHTRLIQLTIPLVDYLRWLTSAAADLFYLLLLMVCIVMIH